MSDQKTPLGMIAVPDDILKRDIEVLDRYQAFSSELLRISLLAIPSLGFLLTHFFLHHDDKIFLNAFKDGHVGLWACVALISFGLSAAFALGHRYISSDSLTTHIIALRHTIRNAPGDVAAARRAGKARKWRFILSGVLLAASASALFAGALSLAICFSYAISYIGRNV